MKNEYRVEGDLTYILLRNRKGEQYETVIDTIHLEKIKELKLSWHLKWEKNTKSYYCKATKYLGLVDGKPKYQTVHLHNVIKPLTKKGTVIHHKNHDTLDNTDSNLEEIPNKKNVRDRRGANPNSKTGIRNVTLFNNKYIVQLYINGRNTKIGSFDNLDDAAKCAEESRKIYYSE